jgi:hypothetical protein
MLIANAKTTKVVEPCVSTLDYRAKFAETTAVHGPALFHHRLDAARSSSPCLQNRPNRGNYANSYHRAGRQVLAPSRHRRRYPVFGRSTIERWFYQARKAAHDPMASLRDRKRPCDAGASLSPQAVRAQYHEHPSWTCQLHYDNLKITLDEANTTHLFRTRSGSGPGDPETRRSS